MSDATEKMARAIARELLPAGTNIKRYFSRVARAEVELNATAAGLPTPDRFRAAAVAAAQALRDEDAPHG